jgi:hypothetical protein
MVQGGEKEGRTRERGTEVEGICSRRLLNYINARRGQSGQKRLHSLAPCSCNEEAKKWDSERAS